MENAPNSNIAKIFFIEISLMIETPPFRAVESKFIWEGCNPFQTRATYGAAPYVQPRMLKHQCITGCGTRNCRLRTLPGLLYASPHAMPSTALSMGGIGLPSASTSVPLSTK